MGVAGFLGAGLARKHGDQRRLALHQLLQAGEHVADLFESVHALGAAAQFAGSLRTAQQQNANQSGFGAAEVEGFARASARTW